MGKKFNSSGKPGNAKQPFKSINLLFLPFYSTSQNMFCLLFACFTFAESWMDSEAWKIESVKAFGEIKTDSLWLEWKQFFCQLSEILKFSVWLKSVLKFELKSPRSGNQNLKVDFGVFNGSGVHWTMIRALFAKNSRNI